MRKIKKFKDFFKLNEDEQKKTPIADDDSKIIAGGVTNLLKQALDSYLGVSGDLLGSIEGDLKKASEYQSVPYKGCGLNEPYKREKIELTKNGLLALMEVLQQKGRGSYNRVIEDLKNNKVILIGWRNKISEREKNDDLFCDLIGYFPKGEDGKAIYEPGSDNSTLFLGTTCPSLSYYGENPPNPDGIGIKAAGETLYTLKKWDPPSEAIPAYEALVESESVEIYRYPKGTKSYKQVQTYKPGSKKKENVGMNIHRSSTGETTGICVGPWSAGCQVIGKGSDFDQLIGYCKGSGQTNFLYALINSDDYYEFKNDVDAKTKQIASASKSETDKKKETKKEA